MSSLLCKLQDNLFHCKLPMPGSRLLVAVSGGADSVALLRGLYALRHDLGLTIIVAHYHHGLRVSARKDQKFVEALAKTLGLLFVTEKNMSHRPVHGSIEEYARTIRYEFLLKTARRLKVDALAVAHTRDDLAETVLMRIFRGTGLFGIRSMALCQAQKDVVFIRPLLNVSRMEVEKFLKQSRASYVTDPTNRSLKFTRNRTRLGLIPYLEKHVAPDVKDRLAALADTAALEYDFLEQAGRAALTRIIKKYRNRVVFETAGFARLHPALRRIVLRMGVASLKDDHKPWELRHVEMIISFVCSDKFGTLSLPQGFSLIKAKGRRTFSIQNR